jgi:hypothetical protein
MNNKVAALEIHFTFSQDIPQIYDKEVHLFTDKVLVGTHIYNSCNRQIYRL